MSDELIQREIDSTDTASVNTYSNIPNSATPCDVYQYKQVTLIHSSSFVCILPDPWNSILYTV